MWRLLFTCLFLFILKSGYAQEYIDLATIAGRLGPWQPYENHVPGSARESGVLVNLKIPVRISPKTTWFNNFTYTGSYVDDRVSITERAPFNIGLHGYILQTGLVQKLDDRHALQLLFVPRYMTTTEGDVGGQVWQFGAIAMHETQFNPNLRLRFGVMYNREMAGDLLVPLIDVRWLISPRWSITGLLPIYGKVNYHLSDRFTMGLSHFGLITSYAMPGESYMERTSIDLALFGKLELVKNIFVEGRLGYALDRTYAMYHQDDQIDLRISIFRIGDDRPAQLNPSFGDGPFAEIRLSYSLPIPE